MKNTVVIGIILLSEWASATSYHTPSNNYNYDYPYVDKVSNLQPERPQKSLLAEMIGKVTDPVINFLRDISSDATKRNYDDAYADPVSTFQPNRPHNGLLFDRMGSIGNFFTDNSSNISKILFGLVFVVVIFSTVAFKDSQLSDLWVKRYENSRHIIDNLSNAVIAGIEQFQNLYD